MSWSGHNTTIAQELVPTVCKQANVSNPTVRCCLAWGTDASASVIVPIWHHQLTHSQGVSVFLVASRNGFRSFYAQSEHMFSTGLSAVHLEHLLEAADAFAMSNSFCPHSVEVLRFLHAFHRPAWFGRFDWQSPCCLLKCSPGKKRLVSIRAGIVLDKAEAPCRWVCPLQCLCVGTCILKRLEAGSPPKSAVSSL